MPNEKKFMDDFFFTKINGRMKLIMIELTLTIDCELMFIYLFFSILFVRDIEFLVKIRIKSKE